MSRLRKAGASQGAWWWMAHALLASASRWLVRWAWHCDTGIFRRRSVMNQEPFLTISLRDGSQAALGDERMRVGEREFAVADIQDARQVAPDPPTIALRVAGARHGVELQPTQPEEGTLLLEAIFRLRPALRPAGFEAPTALPSGFPPLPAPATNPPALGQPWTAQSRWSPNPGLYAPPPGKSAPMPSQGYGSYAP